MSAFFFVICLVFRKLLDCIIGSWTSSSNAKKFSHEFGFLAFKDILFFQKKYFVKLNYPPPPI